MAAATAEKLARIQSPPAAAAAAVGAAAQARPQLCLYCLRFPIEAGCLRACNRRCCLAMANEGKGKRACCLVHPA